MEKTTTGWNEALIRSDNTVQHILPDKGSECWVG